MAEQSSSVFLITGGTGGMERARRATSDLCGPRCAGADGAAPAPSDHLEG